MELLQTLKIKSINPDTYCQMAEDTQRKVVEEFRKAHTQGEARLAEHITAGSTEELGEGRLLC
jgi:hypothetical protein